MYAILDDANVIIGFETREIPLGNLVHPDFIDHYIFTEDETLKVGDVYNRETEAFTITSVVEPVAEIEIGSFLSATDQAIMQTAITIEYMAALMEVQQ